VLFVCFVVASSSSEAQSKFDFSIKNIMRGPELYGRPPSDIHWSADSKWIYFNWVEAGTDWREQPKRFRVRAVPGAKPERVSPAQFDSVGALVTSGDRSKNGRFSVVEFGGDIYVTDLMKGTSRRLTRTNAREHDPVFATDANRVFFLATTTSMRSISTAD
jgi:Tol biopolymer transport system component